jgi:hypothetical protein
VRVTQADEGTRTLDLLRGKQTLQPTELHPRRRGLPRKEDLMTIKAEDILAGSLFGDEERESPGDDDSSSDGAKATARGNES